MEDILRREHLAPLTKNLFNEAPYNASSFAKNPSSDLGNNRMAKFELLLVIFYKRLSWIHLLTSGTRRLTYLETSLGYRAYTNRVSQDIFYFKLSGGTAS